MKVCLLNHGLASGGTDSFVIALASGLISDGYDVTIALAVNPNSGQQFKEEQAIELGAQVHKLSDLGGASNIIRYSWRLFRFLKKEHFDVFHANMDLFNGVNMFIAWLAGVPVRVCHSHTSQSQYEVAHGVSLRLSAYRKIMRVLLWRFSTVRFACAKTAADYLFGSKWRNDSNSHIIYNGIDINKFRASNPSVALNAFKNLITVGRIEACKNPHYIVKIMKALVNIDPNYTLDWVGTGSMLEEVRQEIVDCGLENNIHLLGTQKNIPQLLHNASAFLLPSFFEGLSIALIEAQAAGLSCFVSDTITHEIDVGKCIFLSISDPATRWAEEINALPQNRTQINEAKLRLFDKNNMIAQIEQAYIQPKSK